MSTNNSLWGDHSPCIDFVIYIFAALRNVGLGSSSFPHRPAVHVPRHSVFPRAPCLVCLHRDQCHHHRHQCRRLHALLGTGKEDYTVHEGIFNSKSEQYFYINYLMGIINIKCWLVLESNFCWHFDVVFQCAKFFNVPTSSSSQTIETATAIFLTISMGLSVDYSAHVSHAFVIAQGPSRNDRMKKVRWPSDINTNLYIILYSTVHLTVNRSTLSHSAQKNIQQNLLCN